MTTQEAIQTIQKMLEVYTSECRTLMNYQITALEMAIEALSAQPERILEKAKAEIKKEIKDLKEAGKYHADFVSDNGDLVIMGLMAALKILENTQKEIPSAQPEPLTDKEQRIFLAAMGREREVCKQVDDEWRYGELYESVNLERVCNEIERKVKGALWGGN